MWFWRSDDDGIDKSLHELQELKSVLANNVYSLEWGLKLNRLQRLKLLDAIIFLYTCDGLSASAAELFLLHHYHQQPQKEEKFKNHIGNSIVFRSIEALINQSIIGTYEAIREDEARDGNLDFIIPGKDELRNHRTYCSHPLNVEWDREYMKNFIANELQYRDIKAVRLYQARQTLIDQLQKIDTDSVFALNGAVATDEIIEIIFLCFKSSLKPDVYIPSEMKKHILNFFEEFNKQIAVMASNDIAVIGRTS